MPNRDVHGVRWVFSSAPQLDVSAFSADRQKFVIVLARSRESTRVFLSRGVRNIDILVDFMGSSECVKPFLSNIRATFPSNIEI